MRRNERRRGGREMRSVGRVERMESSKKRTAGKVVWESSHEGDLGCSRSRADIGMMVDKLLQYTHGVWLH